MRLPEKKYNKVYILLPCFLPPRLKLLSWHAMQRPESHLTYGQEVKLTCNSSLACRRLAEHLLVLLPLV